MLRLQNSRIEGKPVYICGLTSCGLESCQRHGDRHDTRHLAHAPVLQFVVLCTRAEEKGRIDVKIQSMVRTVYGLAVQKEVLRNILKKGGEKTAIVLGGEKRATFLERGGGVVIKNNYCLPGICSTHVTVIGAFHVRYGARWFI